MGIRVSGNTSAASVSLVRIRAGVVAVDPKAQVAYTIPAAEISYVELAVSGYLDTTGRFRYITDSAVVIEDLSYSFTKARSSTFTLADATAVGFSKALASSFGTADPRPSFVVEKGLIDAATPLDTDSFNLVKLLTDSALPVDTPSITSGKTLSDVVPELADFTTQNLTKSLFDSVEMQDAAERFIVFLRDFADDASVADAVDKLVSTPEIDGVGVGDVYTPVFTKNLADAFSLNDSSEAGDGSTYSFAKYVNNVVFSSDNLASVLTKPLADSFGTADSGLVVAQSYCDITYFAEDYVGASSSF